MVVNNVTLENYWDRTKPLLPVGPIELQNHSNPLWFKNIYLRELPRKTEGAQPVRATRQKENTS